MLSVFTYPLDDQQIQQVQLKGITDKLQQQRIVSLWADQLLPLACVENLHYFDANVATTEHKQANFQGRCQNVRLRLQSNEKDSGWNEFFGNTYLIL
jgi:hypothetical protein